jgi:hypothetical protein
MVEVDCFAGVSILLFSTRAVGASRTLRRVFSLQIERVSAQHTRIIASHRLRLRITHLLNGDKRWPKDKLFPPNVS